ncbi:DUF456 domain-containing protein [Fuchsiella alkaliacetigena]|uniref:DUF456 domain-containing protein n=1 Tax=Fuchsiella alkaliacetigena TaxID=957042 RepID=UPI00200B8D40|nr:DUF456 domain-containing protein [Fuchsiella alkaliacetigena]MCK8824049.1 DUF456 domain-containing protein [Fuchsiella alkaliacetigena]
MNIILAIIILLLFIISLVGVVVPFIPDTIPLWVAFFLSRFFEPPLALPTSFWLAMLVITLLALSSDFIVNSFFIKKEGGTRWTILAGSIGLLAGPLVIGPIGIIVGPFVLVFVVSFLGEKVGGDVAWNRALGTVMAFFSSSVIKIGLQLIMISWYLYILLF